MPCEYGQTNLPANWEGYDFGSVSDTNIDTS